MLSLLYIKLSHPCMTTGKTIALTRGTSLGKVMSLLFNIQYRFVMSFLPKNNRLLISKLQSPSTFWSPRKQSLSLFPLFPHLFAMNWWDQMPWSSFFECWVLSHLFPLLFHFHQEDLSALSNVICISEVVEISLGSLDSSLWFIQPGILHNVFCI